MKQLTYTIRKSNHCDYCTEHKNGYCKHEKCVYPSEVKKRKGMPWEAVFMRVTV